MSISASISCSLVVQGKVKACQRSGLASAGQISAPCNRSRSTKKQGCRAVLEVQNADHYINVHQHQRAGDLLLAGGAREGEGLPVLWLYLCGADQRTLQQEFVTLEGQNATVPNPDDRIQLAFAARWWCKGK